MFSFIEGHAEQSFEGSKVFEEVEVKMGECSDWSKSQTCF